MTRRGWWLAAVPLAVGVAAAIVLAIARPGVALRLTTPVATLALLAGLAVAVVVLLTTAWRSRSRRRAEEVAAATAAGEERGREQEHDSHRRFVARLDHELKNPVTAIRAALASIVPAGEDQRRAIGTVDAQSARIAGLVGDLRKVGELERAEIERAPVDLGQVAADAVEDVVQAAAANGVTRRVTLALPTAPWPLPHVTGDVDLLHLALTNVVGNAVKYSPAESVVEVRGSEQDGWVQIEVADTGLGVPAGELGSVFDELARSPRTRHLPGSGIGLSLVRVVVERHGGSVAIRSVEGEGTAVAIRLPATGPRRLGGRGAGGQGAT
ncbi:sensor histidine kinase [Serinibacter arcticus]|uniref:Sensor-like histidine kinase SenX3 n=1 Tax=Serinibacter arcticus TaxID=1655435 RepID=A0A2U1ZVP5_9MICO|nr:HAMP domain-containing sensor histidine kinase [Serinibacter arcticus]PWD51067.1 sensor histidine kinase [Serinibacter arcticus]